jgi:hypothetical protein
MLGELRLIIAPKEARLVWTKGDTSVEDEVWRFPRQISKTEAAELIEAAFHDTFDLMQFSVYGDGDDPR